MILYTDTMSDPVISVHHLCASCLFLELSSVPLSTEQCLSDVKSGGATNENKKEFDCTEFNDMHHTSYQTSVRY